MKYHDALFLLLLTVLGLEQCVAEGNYAETIAAKLKGVKLWSGFAS
jgi:hypothetical protein